MDIKYLGYDVEITYDDYDMHKVLVQDLDELNDICQSLKNCDDTFEIEYRKKYKLDDGTFVYSEKEHMSIINQSIPKRELLLGELDVLIQPISINDDIEDKELERCYEIIKEILNKNELEVSELTLLASFRYALGRQSYIVSEVVENVLKNWKYLSKKFKTKIKEEIEEALKNNNTGSYTDVEQWSRILKQQDVPNCAVK